MREESPSSIIAPLSDGNAHGSTEEAVVKDEPHASATTGKGGSFRSLRPQEPAGVGDGDESSMPRAGATRRRKRVLEDQPTALPRGSVPGGNEFFRRRIGR